MEAPTKGKCKNFQGVTDPPPCIGGGDNCFKNPNFGIELTALNHISMGQFNSRGNYFFGVWLKKRVSLGKFKILILLCKIKKIKFCKHIFLTKLRFCKIFIYFSGYKTVFRIEIGLMVFELWFFFGFEV